MGTLEVVVPGDDVFERTVVVKIPIDRQHFPALNADVFQAAPRRTRAAIVAFTLPYNRFAIQFATEHSVTPKEGKQACLGCSSV